MNRRAWLPTEAHGSIFISSVYDRQRRHPRVVSGQATVLALPGVAVGKLLSSLIDELYHVVGETPGVNLGSDPIARLFCDRRIPPGVPRRGHGGIGLQRKGCPQFFGTSSARASERSGSQRRASAIEWFTSLNDRGSNRSRPP